MQPFISMAECLPMQHYHCICPYKTNVYNLSGFQQNYTPSALYFACSPWRWIITTVNILNTLRLLNYNLFRIEEKI